jgi:hypothetical protein
MCRLWTTSRGIQQVYIKGRDKLSPRQRDTVLAQDTWEPVIAPVGVGIVDEGW